MRHATFLRTTSTRAGVVSLLALAIIASLPDTPAVARTASVPRFSSALLPKVGVDPTRIVAADLNADGRPDLATADWTSSTVSVLLGRGTGSFRRRTAYRSARHPAGITASDVDGDGDQDLVSASVDRAGSISVYLNQRSGRFARAVTYRSGANVTRTASSQPTAAGWAASAVATRARSARVV